MNAPDNQHTENTMTCLFAAMVLITLLICSFAVREKAIYAKRDTIVAIHSGLTVSCKDCHGENK